MRKFLSLFSVLVLFCALAFGQTKLITGRVTDQQGQPVQFATIKIKGSKVGTSADADGNFTIRASVGQTLVLSGTGVTQKEVEVGESNSLSLQVARQNSTMTEVIVTSLGIQRQARELGYSTAKVNTDEITQARVTNLGTGLSGKVSGLQINLVNNGIKPDVRVTLRGTRSILGNNQALLVIDGLQLPITYLGTINPDDVANVTVLKGASASALYGSSASNGVLIVTTKRGRGRSQIRLNSTVTSESIAYMPKFQNEFGQYGGEGSAIANTYPGSIAFPSFPFITYSPYENQNYGPRFNGQEVPLGEPIRIYNPDGTFSIFQDSIKYSADPNAKKGFFNKGLTTQNSLSYSSGDDKSTFYLSFQDVNSEGIIPKDVGRRDAIRINGSRESGIFRADYNIGYTLTHNNTTAGSGVPFNWGTSGIAGNYVGGGSYFQNRPLYWTIINSPADINLKNYKNWKTDPLASPDGYFNAYYGNPWWQIDQSRLDEKSADLLGSFTLSLKPTSWLDFSYYAGIARDDYQNKYTQAGYAFAPWAIADTLGAGNIPSSVRTLSPSEGDAISYNQTIQSQFLATAHKKFGDFDGKLIVGTSLIDNTLRLVSTSASALVIPDFFNINNRLGQPTATEYREETRVLGVFGDLTVGWKNFLFLHGSLRNDWNSLLAANNRSYLYPAGDLSFVFTDAIPAFKKSKILNYGKLSFAHSQTAQVSIGAYALQNTFNAGVGFPFGSTAGYSINPVFANANIKPESSVDDELGVTLSFLDSRLLFTAAVYNTKTKNQTIPIAISASTGYTSAYVNSGEMKNQGLELDLKYTVLKTAGGFKWDVGGNFSYNKNTVESLGFGLPYVTIPNPKATNNALSVSSAAVIGEPYGQIRTSDWLRDPQGRIIVDAVKGLPSIDPNQHNFGTTVPPTKIGLQTTVSYAGFTLNAVAEGRFGAVIFNGIGNPLDFTGVSAYSAQTGRQPFVIPNTVIDEGNGKYVPNTNTNTGTPTAGAQTFWASYWLNVGSNYVNSADFWKLREISLTYALPKRWIESTKFISAVTVGVVGRNLITIRAKDNIWSDPEFSNTNGNSTGNTDINQLPPTKFVGANLQITF